MPNLSAPLYVGFDLTNKCNLRCKHCRANASIKGRTELSYEEVKGVLRDLSKMGIVKLVLSGGEPFLREDIFEIISYAVNLDFSDLTIVSNATLLTDEKIGYLKKTGLKHISVSLDGMEEAHDFIRGRGNFQKTVSAVKKLISEGFEVCVVMTVNEFNYKDYLPLINFTNSLGVYQIETSVLMPFGRGEDMESKRLKTDLRNELFKKAKSIGGSLRKNFVSYDTAFLCSPNSLSGREKLVPFMGCRGGRTACAIMYNGDVVACKLLPHIVAGNIRNKSFPAIWADDNSWVGFRETKLLGKCSKCRVGQACRGGCKAIAFFDYGSLKAPDPRCNGPFN